MINLNLNVSPLPVTSKFNYLNRRYEYVSKIAVVSYTRNILFVTLKKKFIKVPFLPSEESAAGDASNSISSLLRHIRISGIYENATLPCIAHRKYGKVWKYIDDHFPSLLFAVKPELVRELSRARKPNAVNLRFRNLHATSVTVPGNPHLFLLTEGRWNIFQNTWRADNEWNTTDLFRWTVRFYTWRFLVLPTRPMDSWWSVVETGYMHTHLYPISKLKSSLNLLVWDY